MNFLFAATFNDTTYLIQKLCFLKMNSFFQSRCAVNPPTISDYFGKFVLELDKLKTFSKN